MLIPISQARMAVRTLSGGEKLEAYLRELSEKVDKPGLLRVGFLEGATYPDKNGTPVAAVAAFNEFGVPWHNQPPRPFFRRMIKAKSWGWGVALGHQLKDTNYNTEKSLDLMGHGIEGQLRESISMLVSPPLAPSTIARKGFDKPLIEHGHMLKSVDHEVQT